jgi:hypothetical protein
LEVYHSGIGDGISYTGLPNPLQVGWDEEHGVVYFLGVVTKDVQDNCRSLPRIRDMVVVKDHICLHHLTNYMTLSFMTIGIFSLTKEC